MPIIIINVKRGTNKFHLLALIIKHTKQSTRLPFNQLQAPRIIGKPDVRPPYPFPPILFLFILEHVLVEIVLEVLVRVVNAELFKTVVWTEVFETEYV